MEKLKQKIIKDGVIINEDVLKVDSFLNHQIDPELIKEMGIAFYEHFKAKGITKVVTIESSGIAPSLMCALYLKVPLVFIKKTSPCTMNDAYTAEVHSFTKNKKYTLCVDSQYLQPDDKVLFIDDFLANGEAFKGAEELLKQANLSIEGVGIVIEKAFQKGHEYILHQGYDLYTLASIASLKNNKIEWY